MKKNSQHGFVALISAIIISSMLLLVIAAMGATTFYSRFNMLDAELKERSLATAEACADRAFIELVLDPTYTGSTLMLNSIDECRVGKVSWSGSSVQFSVQATSSDTAVTNLQIVVNSGDFSIVSWEELTTY
jgi:hypothetical protein